MIHRPGGYRRLVVETHPPPHPGPDETLLDVRAIGVNYADCVVRMGLYSSAREFVGYPITPGFEAAGIERESGRWVVAVTRFGAYATELAVPRSQVFTIPDGMSVEEAAGFPTVFLTAWYALRGLAHPRPGALVLVHSAAGGVGGALVQIAGLLGCRVIGVVGAPHKAELVRELGAEQVVDRSAEPPWPRLEALAPEGFDVIFDANGARSLRDGYAHLAPTGRLVVYGFHTMLPRRGGRPNWARIAWTWLRTPRFDPLAMTRENRSVLAFNLSYLFDRQDLLAEGMTELLEWAARGEVRVPRVTRYAFSNVAAAHAALESGQTIGKLVLTVDPAGSTCTALTT